MASRNWESYNRTTRSLEEDVVLQRGHPKLPERLLRIAGSLVLTKCSKRLPEGLLFVSGPLVIGEYPYPLPPGLCVGGRIMNVESYPHRFPEGIVRPRFVPEVPHIDATIFRAIQSGGGLEMRDWHTCKTTHCRAGWAITLAGKAGALLEDSMSSYMAGRLIYEASRPDLPCPSFFGDNEKAMEDIRACAEKDPLP